MSGAVGKSMRGCWSSAGQRLLLAGIAGIIKKCWRSGIGLCDVETSLGSDVLLAELSYPAARVLELPKE